MDMNEQNIEQIVKQVLSQMSGTAARKAPAANSDIPKTARVAMLTKLEHYDIKEFPIPEVGDDDILVKSKAVVSAAQTHTNLSVTPSVLFLLHSVTRERVRLSRSARM